MPELKQIKLSQITEFFKPLPRLMGEHAFPTLLVLIFFALLSGGLLFYKYGFLAEKAKPEARIQPLQFQEDVYQNVLKEWARREKRFQDAGTKIYPDLFSVH